LPDLEEFTAWVSDAHAVGRNVAVHCVTQAELILTLTALDEAGIQAGDRIEHGSVIASELLSRRVAQKSGCRCCFWYGCAVRKCESVVSNAGGNRSAYEFRACARSRRDGVAGTGFGGVFVTIT